MRVPVFQKSDDPQRIVCYCFEHSVQAVREEVQRTGRSQVPEDIREKCRAGLDRCPLTNPQGVCCLGNVLGVVQDAKADSLGGSSERIGQNCCADEKQQAKVPAAPKDAGRLGLWSAGGALAAAILSSACCWLPLALIGGGVSVLGVAGFLETYRWLLVGAAAVLLGGGFYYVYMRKAEYAPGAACAVPDRRLQRLNRGLLWVAAVFVAAFAAFPEYVGLLIGADDSEEVAIAAAAASPSSVTREYAIEGMTCTGCTVHIQQAIEKLPGVQSVEIAYAGKKARVRLDPGRVKDQNVLAAVKETGFEVRPSSAKDASP